LIVLIASFLSTPPTMLNILNNVSLSVDLPHLRFCNLSESKEDSTALELVHYKEGSTPCLLGTRAVASNYFSSNWKPSELYLDIIMSKNLYLHHLLEVTATYSVVHLRWHYSPASLMEFSQSALFWGFFFFQFLILHLSISVCTQFTTCFFVILFVDFPGNYYY